jgi:uncharacterized UBP type Zn finger protein
VQINRFRQHENKIVKDCSYLSFEEEIEMGEYVLSDEYNEKYKVAISEAKAERMRYGDEGDEKDEGSLLEVLKVLKKESERDIGALRNVGGYELHGVIVHSGSTMGGHYHCYVRKYLDDDEAFNDYNNNDSNKNKNVMRNDKSLGWWHFDDSQAVEVSWERYE